jgi:hypothetical protein
LLSLVQPQLIDAKAGTLENVVDLGVTKVRAQATCKAISDERTDVAINGAGLYTGPLRVPLGVQVRNSSSVVCYIGMSA